MAIGDKIKRVAARITDRMYAAYGSHTGYLFGIPPEYREVVQTVVEVALDEVGIDELEEARGPEEG